MTSHAWKHRHEFAEFAEALGITTDAIAAAYRKKGKVIVLWQDLDDPFTVADDPDEPLLVTLLLRRPDGILAPEGDPIRTTLTARSLLEQFGEPPA